MGLASKMAAVGGYPPSGPPQPGQAAAYPGYPAYQPAGQGPPLHQGGYPPQSGAPQDAAQYKQLLLDVIREKNLGNMISPNDRILDDYAARAAAQVGQLCQKWQIPHEIGRDVVKLALFDIILFIDNSGSMAFEENGERIKDLQLIVNRVASAAALFDTDGISIRFMNQSSFAGNPGLLDHVKTEQQIMAITDDRRTYKGLTPLGTELRKQVIDPFIVQRARNGQLQKPVLVITVTDGQPAGEPLNALADALSYVATELSRMPRYGRGAASFQFAQVGNDQAARTFLSQLDENGAFGDIIDCTSNFENEQAEMMKATPPVDLTPTLWLVKLLLGAIDSSYDTQDEKKHASAGGHAPHTGQYGAPGGYNQQPQPYPPQGGYPAQQPPYGQQQQQSYGRPAPPYPPQQPGYPGQQGGYAAPPQQPGYPGQQGGYGAPPPPPRY